MELVKMTDKKAPAREFDEEYLFHLGDCCDKATEGPWSYDDDENEIHADTRQDAGGDPFHISPITKRSDAIFIVNARTAMPKLLKEITALQSEVERLRSALERILKKKPNMVNQNEAADMAIEFQIIARAALSKGSEG